MDDTDLTARLVALDVDGTIAGPGGLYADAAALLDWLSATGIVVALCSARPLGSLRRLADRFPCVRYAAALQGSLVHRLRPEPAQLASWPLPAAVVDAVLAAAAGHEVWRYAGDEWLVEARTAAVADEIATVGVEPVLAADLGARPTAHKLLVLGADPSLVAPAGGRARRSGAGDVEVIAATVPDTKGLDVVVADAGVEPAGVVAVGDGDNDVGMLRVAGRPFALPPLADAELWPGVTRLPSAGDGGLRLLLEHLR